MHIIIELARAGSEREIKKMAVGRKRKTEISQYLPKSTKTGDFNLWRTLSGSFFVIPERLALIHTVVLVFTTNKQNKTLNYIYSIFNIQ